MCFLHELDSPLGAAKQSFQSNVNSGEEIKVN